MKWLRITIALSIVLTAQLARSDSKMDPWRLEPGAIVNLPFSSVYVRRFEDGKSLEIRLNKWDSNVEESISRAFIISSLAYRLHPSRFGVMSVEVYSPVSEIDFFISNKGGSTDILIGKVRPGKKIVDVLSTGTKSCPITPEIIELFLSGQFAEAKEKLAALSGNKSDTQTDDEKALLESRTAIVDLIAGGQIEKCPFAVETIQSVDSMESVILTAWCHYYKDNFDKAFDALDRLKEIEIPKSIKTRADALEMRMALEKVLWADRNERIFLASKYIVKKRDMIFANTTSGLLLEILGEILMRSFLGGIISEIAQDRMSKAKSSEAIALAPLLAESYWSIRDQVHAFDTASYFLTHKQPEWVEGRLRRIRGLIYLQKGIGDSSYVDFMRAKQLLKDWTLEDQLALFNAGLLANKDIDNIFADLKPFLNRIQADERKEKWFTNLKGEMDLKEGTIPSPEILDMLSSYVLFGAALEARAKGDLEKAKTLLYAVSKRKDKWGELAGISIEVETIQKRSDIARRTFK